MLITIKFSRKICLLFYVLLLRKEGVDAYALYSNNTPKGYIRNLK
jgi:hypothetical protein